MHAKRINIHFMSTKSERLQVIRDIINANKIHRQEELLSLLVNRGFDTTQATLSRDLRELEVGKIHDTHFGSIYFIPDETIIKEDGRPVLQGVVSLELSGNMAVLKTRPGFANSVAVKVDETEIPEIIGTIAGNDTILMMIKEGATHTKVLSAFESRFPELLEILI